MSVTVSKGTVIDVSNLEKWLSVYRGYLNNIIDKCNHTQHQQSYFSHLKGSHPPMLSELQKVKYILDS